VETYTFQGIVTALDSISHNGGQSMGISSKLRREKFVQPNRTIEDVPVISGNSVRGILRDRGMLNMCRVLGYGVDDESGKVRGLSLAAFYFLFSGGALTKDAGRGLDIDLARQMRELIPLIGVFGAACGNQIMPGKVKIGKMKPICKETRHLVPGQFQFEDCLSIWDYLQEEMYTRKDDDKNEQLRQLIAPEVRGLLEDKRVVAKARDAEGKPQSDTGQHQQMRYYVETFAAGTQFYWQIVLDDVTEIEFEAFITALAEFSRLPYIGGKSAVGHGKIKVEFENWFKIDPHIEDKQAVGKPLGTLYADHLRNRGDEIREVLSGIA
jgi:CRISPR type IV-associated protein Csf2